jgi:hypothetical protein
LICSSAFKEEQKYIETKKLKRGGKFEAVG